MSLISFDINEKMDPFQIGFCKILYMYLVNWMQHGFLKSITSFNEKL
jgi:hypothetical protein